MEGAMLAVEAGQVPPRKSDLMRTRFALVLALCAAAPLLACATAPAPIRVPAVRPAEIDLADFRSVAIGELHGRADKALSERVEEALVATNHFREVIDQK